GDSLLAGERDVPPGGVAGAAEVHGSGGVLPPRCGEGGLHLGELPFRDRGHVPGPRAMARLARDPGDEVRHVENALRRGRRRVAGEAAARFRIGERTSRRLLEVAWRLERAARGEAEPARGVEEARAALVEPSVPLVDPGLADSAHAEGPAQGQRERAVVLLYGVDALAARRRDAV